MMICVLSNFPCQTGRHRKPISAPSSKKAGAFSDPLGPNRPQTSPPFLLEGPAPAGKADQGFELVGVQTAEERSEANRQRAEQEGDVLEIDDDSSAVAQAEPPSQPGKGEDSEVIEID